MATRFDLVTKRNKRTGILAGNQILAATISNLPDYRTELCFVIIDEHVLGYYPDLIPVFEEKFDKVIVGEVPPGERSKSLKEFDRLTDLGLKSNIRRSTPVFAIGGGVTGDLAGFVAASLLRGVPLIHVPTTLLAMVDSSIGGKTGVNHITGKNLIGAFYQPDQIIMDVAFLATLPPKEWNCGLGEVIKYACISDRTLFELIEDLQSNKSAQKLEELVSLCARIKCDIVGRDELESGVRSFLNYGHTFAHALESFTNYTRFAHGEAVYVGLLAATYFSMKSGANVNCDRLVAYRDAFNLKTIDLLPHIETLIDSMQNDKKITGKTLRLVTLDSWQQPVLSDADDKSLIRESWYFALEQSHCN